MPCLGDREKGGVLEDTFYQASPVKSELDIAIAVVMYKRFVPLGAWNLKALRSLEHEGGGDFLLFHHLSLFCFLLLFTDLLSSFNSFLPPLSSPIPFPI